MALCKHLSARKDQQDFYNKYGKDNTSSSGCKWRREHEASSSRDKRAVEGWMTRFQIADREKMAVGYPHDAVQAGPFAEPCTPTVGVEGCKGE